MWTAYIHRVHGKIQIILIISAFLFIIDNTSNLVLVLQSTRKGFYLFLSLIPLPFITLKTISRYNQMFYLPSQSLSLERAREIDVENCNFTVSDLFDPQIFSKHTYRQPVLTEEISKPTPYRHNMVDKVTDEVNSILNEDEEQNMAEKHTSLSNMQRT